jgi:V8-like Glu-specific endopeptidase
MQHTSDGAAKHAWLAIALLAFVLACCPAVNGPSDIVQDIENQTILIHSTGFVCAGVWVSSTSALTAGHCAVAMGCPDDDDDDEDLENEGDSKPCDPVGTKFQLKTRSEEATQGVVVKYSKRHDLALVYVVDPPRHAVGRLSDVPPRVGDTIHIVGHPMGIKWTYTKGVVSGTLDADKDTSERLQISAHIHPGNSGGGVFDERGKLIGLVSFNAGPFAGDLTFISQENQLREFLGSSPWQ